MSTEQFNTFSAWILESLYRASWQGGIAAILVWAICSLFPRLPATARSWLWRLVFLKMILAFIWVRPVELALLTPPETPASSHQITQVAPIPKAEAPVSSGSQEVPSAIMIELAEDTDALTIENTGVPAEPITAATNSVVPFWSAHWKTLLTSLWSCGVLVGFVLLGRQFHHARTLRRSATRCSEERVVHPFIALTRAMSLVRLPQICTSTSTTRPMLIGIMQPTLIFPEALLATVSPEALRMMIAHELAHIRRSDLAWTALAAMVRTVFFFHPLVWLARCESLLAQEIACDELALRITSSTTTRYAEMLVDVVSLPASPAPALISLGVAESRKTLERRIRNMKFIGHNKTKLVQFVTAIALFTALIALIPLRLIAAKPEVSDRSTPLEITVDLTAHKSEPLKLLEQLQGKSRAELRQLVPTYLDDPLLTQYLRDLSQAEQQLSSIREDYPKEHPELIRSAKVMEQINKQVDARIDGILAGLKAQANIEPDRSEADSNLPTLLHSQAVLPATPSQPQPQQLARILREVRDKDRAELRQILITLTGDTLLTEHLRALSEAEQKFAAAQSDYADEHPELIRARKVMKTINDQIENRIDGILAALEIKASAEAKLDRDRTASATDPVDEREDVQLNGRSTISVHARTGGSVEKVLVRVGERVKKGQPLIEMDNSDAQSRLNTAEARAKISQADLQIAKVEFEEAQRDYARKKQLAEDRLAAMGSLPNLEKFRANIVKAEAQAQLAVLELEQTKQDMNRNVLRAPRDGVITFIIHESYWVPEGSGKILAEIRTREGDRAERIQAVERLEHELADLRAKERELLLKYTPNSSRVINLQRRIADLENRLHAEEITASIDERLEEQKQRAPEVFVNGSVNKPGAIQLAGEQDLDILGAIARAGGFTQRANRDKIRFTRPGGEKRVFSFEDLKNPKNRIPLRPGDIIEVPDKLI